ncbi:uncharacterized protein LOC135082525 [Ostrinia nubilalis]|uniref:uncharacterized protein LOC135082525 n=1 Tax=Ostrinia nubilalis TaxID=29057 RepID=UPI0030823BFD
MSDSSDNEDLSRFREAVDTSFTTLIDQSRGKKPEQSKAKEVPELKSERYLEVASHYNDVKVPAEMQKQIGAKISAIIDKKIKFVDVENNFKKRKIKGGVKLFRDSSEYLSHEDAKDTYTESHNAEAKKLRKKKKDTEYNNMDENEKLNATVVSGEYVLSKEETKCWKSRRKEKIFKYKSQGKSKVLTAVE